MADTSYYIRQALRGQYITLQIDADTREFVVYLQNQEIKRVPIKGLVGQRVTFTQWMDGLSRDIRRERARSRHIKRRGSARS